MAAEATGEIARLAISSEKVNRLRSHTESYQPSPTPIVAILDMSPSGHAADALPACRFVGGGLFVYPYRPRSA
jgi:hypothetical protein